MWRNFYLYQVTFVPEDLLQSKKENKEVKEDGFSIRKILF